MDVQNRARRQNQRTCRRRFLKTIVAAGCVVPFGFSSDRVVRADDVLRIVLVLPTAAETRAHALRRGVLLGIEEAERAGELLGRSVELTETSGPARNLRDARPTAIVGGSSEAECMALSKQADRSGALFVNAGCSAGALRGSACHGAMFHVEAGAGMYRAAREAYERRSGRSDVEAVLWHPSLFRYGAAQLNERFRDRFDEPMTAPAWSGWMAVKVLWEAFLKTGSVHAPELAAYLGSPDRRFDGHKGWPLSFHPANRQLRQPLYLLNSDREIVGEAPIREEDGGVDPQEQLDQLGISDDAVTCGGAPRETNLPSAD